jgi:hypothetical protein
MYFHDCIYTLAIDSLENYTNSRLFPELTVSSIPVESVNFGRLGGLELATLECSHDVIMIFQVPTS